jgi:hypothetical protein
MISSTPPSATLTVTKKTTLTNLIINTIRLAASVALFFCAIYLMRVLGKLGLAFFVVALAG